jgi:hypothetical protein
MAFCMSVTIASESAVKPLFDSIKTHALKDAVYKQFYLLMLEKQSVKLGHDNWGGIVFHAEGNWQELAVATSTIQMNLYRLQAIRSVVNGNQPDCL